MKPKGNQYKYGPIFVFILFGLFVYVQHQFVYMYFDDYGYVSLTYGCSIGNGGVDYSLVDIFRFLKWHYLNWGGRVIPFFAEILILKQGLWLMRIIQTLVIIGIYVIMYRTLVVQDNRKNIIISIILVSLFASIGILQMKNGVYWFTASVLYLWPMLFFLLSILLQRKKNKTKKCVIFNAILFFLAGFSFEQYAVMVIVYALFVLILEKVNNHKISIDNFVICASGIVGAMCELLAPGNFVRNSSNLYEKFYETPFIPRTIENLKKLLQINLGYSNEIYVIFICVAIGGVIVNLFVNGKINCRIRDISIGALIFLVIGYILCRVKNVSGIVYIEGCIALMFCVYASIYFVYSKRYYCLGLLLAGICSQGMMIVSPAIVERCALPFTFIMHFLLAIEITEVSVKNKIYLNIIIGILVIASWVNYAIILHGYRGNSTINEINHYKLVEKSERISAGEDIDSIILYKLVDDTYASDMPYQQNFMEAWWKEYHNLPQNIRFVWRDYQKPSECHEVVVFDEIELVSVWPEVIDENATFNEDGSINIAAIPSIVSDDCRIVVNGEIFNTTIDNGFISTTIPADMLKKDLTISIVNSNTGVYSNSITMKVQLNK